MRAVYSPGSARPSATRSHAMLRKYFTNDDRRCGNQHESSPEDNRAVVSALPQWWDRRSKENRGYSCQQKRSVLSGYQMVLMFRGAYHKAPSLLHSPVFIQVRLRGVRHASQHTMRLATSMGISWPVANSITELQRGRRKGEGSQARRWGFEWQGMSIRRRAVGSRRPRSQPLPRLEYMKLSFKEIDPGADKM